MDLLGRQIPFDRMRYDRFQGLLRRYGDTAQVAAKCEIIRAVLGGEPPSPDPLAQPGATRRAASLALRQLASLNADPVLLQRWRKCLDGIAHGASPGRSARESVTDPPQGHQ